MKAYILARIVHVLAVVLWIGGVAMVTTTILPMIRKLRDPDVQIKTFENIEKRFQKQARITTLLTALSGFYMLYAMDAWHRYLNPHYWWIHLMTFVWLVFTLILFVFEPLFLHRIFRKYANTHPQKTFLFVYRAHVILLILSLVTIVGAVAGSHGWLI